MNEQNHQRLSEVTTARLLFKSYYQRIPGIVAFFPSPARTCSHPHSVTRCPSRVARHGRTCISAQSARDASADTLHARQHGDGQSHRRSTVLTVWIGEGKKNSRPEEVSGRWREPVPTLKLKLKYLHVKYKHTCTLVSFGLPLNSRTGRKEALIEEEVEEEDAFLARDNDTPPRNEQRNQERERPDAKEKMQPLSQLGTVEAAEQPRRWNQPRQARPKVGVFFKGENEESDHERPPTVAERGAAITTAPAKENARTKKFLANAERLKGGDKVRVRDFEVNEVVLACPANKVRAQLPLSDHCW